MLKGRHAAITRYETKQILQNIIGQACASKSGRSHGGSRMPFTMAVALFDPEWRPGPLNQLFELICAEHPGRLPQK